MDILSNLSAQTLLLPAPARPSTWGIAMYKILGHGGYRLSKILLIFFFFWSLNMYWLQKSRFGEMENILSVRYQVRFQEQWFYSSVLQTRSTVASVWHLLIICIWFIDKGMTGLISVINISILLSFLRIFSKASLDKSCVFPLIMDTKISILSMSE